MFNMGCKNSILKGTWYTVYNTWSTKTRILYVLSDIFINHDVSKIWMILFWPRVHRCEKWSQSGKTPPGGRAEIGNVKYAKKWHFQFQLRHQVALLNFYSTFHIYGTLPKKVSFRLLIRRVLTNFTEILLHVYQVSLKHTRYVEFEKRSVNWFFSRVHFRCNILTKKGSSRPSWSASIVNSIMLHRNDTYCHNNWGC